MAFMSAISLSPFLFNQFALMGWDVFLVSYFYYICQVNCSTTEFVLEMSNCVLRSTQG